MRITGHLNVTAEEFFAKVDEALLTDIATARGKKAKPSNLHEGFTYKKFLRGKADPVHAATVRIVAYDRPLTYRSSITTEQGESLMGYDVVSSGEGIDVTYVEEFKAAGGLKSLFARVVAPFQALGARGRVRSQLQAMEGRIIADRYPDPDGKDASDGAEDAA